MKKKRPDVVWHKVGNLWVGDRTGGKLDPQELIDALENADLSHLKPCPQGPRS